MEMIYVFLYFIAKICLDLQISTVQQGEYSEWHLGPCNNLGTEYVNHRNYIQRCCLEPGQHTLTCINKRKPYGWDDGYIEIQGHRYCNDFMSYKITQKITIKGMNQIIITYNLTEFYSFSLYIVILII